jgi:glycine/D-amino acid oxidase-like deaminating enzyme
MPARGLASGGSSSTTGSRPSMRRSRRRASLVGVNLKGGWAGLYENTPDHNALIGRARSPGNFLYATGFSGHGFLQAPAVGELITDLFLQRDPLLDLRPFRADRFRDAEALSEVHII